ncbi:hypothetical protein G7066_01665 [Leucobacter coleopterorum]|uniref:Uncharacterized protein n=1 Tax=Leucobacter coleopterorum TaxID=2714933 RepID=A0ABX6JXS0_9MICO|nr:hypothetical protein [Leucobacter coleopterorum]QIM17734.1 hypothetical protein G7066_01665 [Leucobacter coleopterorum]
MTPTIAWTELPTGKRALVMLAFVAGVILQTSFSTWVVPGPGGVPEHLLPAIAASILLFSCLALLLLRSHLTLRSIVLSSIIATLVFAAAYALFSQLASSGPQDLIGSALTRILYYSIATGDIVVAFFLCMIVGVVVRFLHLNPERKSLRYR